MTAELDYHIVTQAAIRMLHRWGASRDGGAAWWAHEHAFGNDMNTPNWKYWIAVRNRIRELERVKG